MRNRRTVQVDVEVWNALINTALYGEPLPATVARYVATKETAWAQHIIYSLHRMSPSEDVQALVEELHEYIVKLSTYIDGGITV